MWGYFRKVFSTAEKWADENKLLKVDLCGGINPPKGYISYDLQNADIVGDLDEDWKLEDDSVGVLRAWNALEHLKDPIHAMNEAYRVLAHEGFFLINVPSTDGRGAFQDPTHRSFWNSNSFDYYTEPETRKYIEPMCKCRFKLNMIENIKGSRRLVYTRVHLNAIKED